MLFVYREARSEQEGLLGLYKCQEEGPTTLITILTAPVKSNGVDFWIGPAALPPSDREGGPCSEVPILGAGTRLALTLRSHCPLGLEEAWLGKALAPAAY